MQEKVVISLIRTHQTLSMDEKKVWQTVKAKKKTFAVTDSVGVIETEMLQLLLAEPSAFLKLYRRFLIPHSDSSPTEALTCIRSDSILITDIPGGQY